MLGSPGPNIGYALLLTTRMADRFQLAGEERRDDAVAVVAEIAMRRAASFGRAPVGHDVDFAAELLGYVGDVQLEIPEWRAHVVHHAAHDYPTRRFVVDAIPAGVLRLEVGELASRLAAIRDSLRSAVIRPTRA